MDFLVHHTWSWAPNICWAAKKLWVKLIISICLSVNPHHIRVHLRNFYCIECRIRSINCTWAENHWAVFKFLRLANIPQNHILYWSMYKKTITCLVTKWRLLESVTQGIMIYLISNAGHQYQGDYKTKLLSFKKYEIWWGTRFIKLVKAL